VSPRVATDDDPAEIARYNSLFGPPRKVATMSRTAVAVVALVSLAGFAAVQAERQFKWKVHDLTRPQPTVVDPGPAGPASPVPSDAIVLFGAKKPDLSAWQSGDGSEAKWKVVDGAMVVEAGTGDIKTRAAFGDVQLHVEWMVPSECKVEGQHGGNSGVFFMDRYELQVVSSNGNETYPDGTAGALYGQYPPLVNACRPQGQWNTYDVVFRAPVFGKDGIVLHPATATVFFNDVLVQDNSEILGATAHGARAKYGAHAAELPIRLQDHGDPIRFRNVWARKLPPRSPAE
jgi:hypothetical protein